MNKTLFAFLLLANSSFADTDKRSRYNLFNPTPESEMRGLNTDRPDKTESAYTVDAGHFQVETDLVNLTLNRERVSDTRSSILNLNNINLKVGLSDNSDLQLITASYVEQRSKTSSEKVSQKGIGDTYLRYKYNFFGNNDGQVAVGVMPFVKLPTAAADMSNDRVEGGVVLPITLSLPNEWGLGLMVEIDHLRQDNNLRWQTDYVFSASLGHNIVGDLSGFVELYSRGSDNRHQGSIMTFDLGLTYLVTPRIQLDTGAFFGLTEAADDFNTFLGASFLF